MKIHISHPTINGRLYELIKVVEFDVALGDDGFTVRVELFRAISSPSHFRAHVWKSEFFRIQSTFPQTDESHEPAHQPSDELIFTDHSDVLQEDYSDFQAENETSALQLVLDDYGRFLSHVTGQ